jgi:hypothetical protein
MSKIVMRRHPLTWFFVLLLCAAGVWLLMWGSHSSQVKVTPSAASQFAAAWKSTPHRVASQDAIKDAVHSTATNNFAWRLSNTSKPLKQLMHDPHAILLENAFIDTSAKLNLPIPNNLRSGRSRRLRGAGEWDYQRGISGSARLVGGDDGVLYSK